MEIMVARSDGRRPNQLRPGAIDRHYTDFAPGAVLMAMGKTRVLCTAAFEEDVPRWMRDSGKGGVTAEYSMLPGSSSQRVRRTASEGGRTKEIQRLIGRSLRAVVDTKVMGPLTARVDCDVLQADGGTRTASITGAWIALADAFDQRIAAGKLEASPLTDHIAAISVGLIGDDALLDLEYTEDVTADVDANVVMTGSGKIVEVQGTAEGEPFDRGQLDRMLDLAAKGIAELVDDQRAARA